MCLLVKEENVAPLVAEEDLKFYKVLVTNYPKLVQRVDHAGYPIRRQYETVEGLFSPYQHMEVKYNHSYFRYGSFDIAVDCVPDGYYCKVTGNGFHLFETVDDAQNYIDRNFGKRGVLVEAIVPKGSTYMRGDFITSCGPAYKSVVTNAVEYKPYRNPDVFGFGMVHHTSY